VFSYFLQIEQQATENRFNNLNIKSSKGARLKAARLSLNSKEMSQLLKELPVEL